MEGEGSGPFLGRGAGPHLTQSPRAEAYLHTKWNLNLCSHLVATNMGRKLGAGCAPLGRGRWVPFRAESYQHAKFHLGPSNRLATIHQRHSQTDRQTDRQRSDSIGRTVLQTVAQKLYNRFILTELFQKGRCVLDTVYIGD